MKKRIMAKTSWFCSKNLIIVHLIIFLFTVLLFLPGCGSFIATSSSKIDVGVTSSNSTKDSSAETTKANNEETTQTSNTDETTSSTNDNSSTESTTETTKVELKIKVYYSNADGSALVGEERIFEGSHKYLEAFLELIKPPITPGLIQLVPVTTKINKISIKDGNIDLDLSKNLIDDRFKSDFTDILLVHSIVNTLTEFKEVNTVTFYIDGKKGSSLGQMDISGPIFRDESFIQKN
ncbi:MAG: GerMN domain-containing protein [Candidatus Humimicrobiaceae bacterium]